MKIPTKIHGMLDYAVGLLFLLMPLLLDIDTDSVPARVFQYLGIATVVYSILTRYEYGLIKLLPMKVHLGLDLLSGIFLIISPWIFGFADQLFVPYMILGLFEVMVTILTSSRSGYDKAK